ncbi:MAG: putative PurR-regulated permease PerM [Crocinitomicaceae bacterium]|jgi:predicted PurR-regulated permease PerM
MVAALAVITVYLTGAITMPIIFSGLCAMLVHPLVKKLESLGLNLTLSSLVAVLGVTFLLAAIFGLIAYQSAQIVSALSIDNVEPIIDNPIKTLDSHVGLDLRSYQEQIDVVILKSKKAGTQFIMSTLLNFNSALIFLLTCPIYIFFMLITRSQIRKFYYTSFKPENRAIASRILQQIEMVYLSYIRGLLYVMIIVAVLTGLGLFALGIQHAFFLGILAGFLTLIPYIGVIVSGLIPVVIALLTKDSIWYAVGVIAVFSVVQFLEGNIITPKIMGKQVGINPLVVILSVIIFGAVGGILGMILTIPILALLKTTAYYVPGWRPFRNLLQAK